MLLHSFYHILFHISYLRSLLPVLYLIFLFPLPITAALLEIPRHEDTHRDL